MPEKKLIFDTTVLSNFFFADATSLLIERYNGRGIISTEVYDEVAAGILKDPALQRIDILLNGNHFDVITLPRKERHFYISLLDFLGKGEASCIAYARSRHCIVASDDKAARKICERYAIRCTGTIGILIASCRDGRIEEHEADLLLQKMECAGYYSPVRRISDLL